MHNIQFKLSVLRMLKLSVHFFVKMTMIFLLIFSFTDVSFSKNISNQMLLTVRVSNSQGDPISGIYSKVSVLLYDGTYSKDKNPLWEEIHENIVFNNGTAFFELGKYTSLTAENFSIQDPNIVLRIENDFISVPMYSVGYAYRAHEADKVKWKHVEGAPVFDDNSADLKLKSVGIGIDKPSTQLEVSGNIKLSGNIVSSGNVKVSDLIFYSDQDEKFIDIESYVQKFYSNLQTDIKTSVLDESSVDQFVSNNGYIVANNNLSEISNPIKARENIGLGSVSSPTFNRVIVNQVTYSVGNLGSSTGGAISVDWKQFNKNQIALTSNSTYSFTFTPPPGPTTLLLVLNYKSDINSIVWPNSVKWPGGIAAPLSKKTNTTDVIQFFYDGNSYLGIGLLDFR